MTISWGNAGWLRRLIELAQPAQDEVLSSGLVLSTQLVNDARYLGSREANPAGVYGFETGAAAPGDHNVVAFEALDASVPSSVLIHAARVFTPVGGLQMSFTVDPQTTLTWATGPFTNLARTGDLGVDARIRVTSGTVAVANLPGSRFPIPPDVAPAGGATFTQHNWGPIPPLFSANQAITLNCDTAAQVMRVWCLAQAVRD